MKIDNIKGKINPQGNISHPKLLIVESPSKVKTIGSYFKVQDNMRVLATYGHLRSLPSKPDSINFGKENIEFSWVVNKANITSTLLQAIHQCEEIILATDCDREGEAISWHVVNLMKENNIYENKIVHRITFQEITPKSIKNALEHKKDINMNLVNAYLARLTKDYSCGFGITEKMWAKLRCGYSSAGRVQSPTLEIIRQREEEIRHFLQKNFYSISCWLHNVQCVKVLIDEGELWRINEEKVDQDCIPTLEEAEKISKKLIELEDFLITESEIKRTKSKKVDPLKTSTLQQICNSRLHFDGKRTMSIAQSLYEGVNIDNNMVGLITYMRTDSTYLNPDFIKEAQEYINDNYGEKYVEKNLIQSKKAKNAQEAHEAIRPTNIKYVPEKIRQYLSHEQFQLYEIIWNSALSSLISPAEYANLNVILQNKIGPNNLDKNQERQIFSIKKNFKSLIFDGHLCLDGKSQQKEQVQNLEELQKLYKIGTVFKIDKTMEIHHKTMPPARYNSGSLVKRMEEMGLGRPSTYAPTVEMLLKYQYCTVNTQAFTLNAKGAIVSLFLQKYFPRFLKVEATNIMENVLDEIANGEKDWELEVRNFEKDLRNNINEVHSMSSFDVLNQMHNVFFSTFNLERKCSKCEKNELILAIRMNLFVKCLSCDANFTLDTVVGGVVNYPIDKIYTIKKSIYGPYLENSETRKNTAIPMFIELEKINSEMAKWLDQLPKEIEEGALLKVGKYGFYMEKGEKKIPISEKSLEVIMNYPKNRLMDIMASEPKKASGGKGQYGAKNKSYTTAQSKYPTIIKKTAVGSVKPLTSTKKLKDMPSTVQSTKAATAVKIKVSRAKKII